MKWLSSAIVAISLLICACSTPAARDPILVDEPQAFVANQIATVSGASVWYLGTAAELHHFKVNKIPGGSVYFAVRRSTFDVPVEFPLHAKEAVSCFEWFTTYPNRDMTEEDAKLIKRIVAVPLREAQSNEEKK